MPKGVNDSVVDGREGGLAAGLCHFGVACLGWLEERKEEEEEDRETCTIDRSNDINLKLC